MRVFTHKYYQILSGHTASGWAKLKAELKKGTFSFQHIGNRLEDQNNSPKDLEIRYEELQSQLTKVSKLNAEYHIEKVELHCQVSSCTTN